MAYFLSLQLFAPQRTFTGRMRIFAFNSLWWIFSTSVVYPNGFWIHLHFWYRYLSLFFFYKRDQLGKEFWLMGWCLRMTLHEMVDLIIISCLPQKLRELFSPLSFPLILPFPHTLFYTILFATFWAGRIVFTEVINLTNLVDKYAVLGWFSFLLDYCWISLKKCQWLEGIC